MSSSPSWQDNSVVIGDIHLSVPADAPPKDIGAAVAREVQTQQARRYGGQPLHDVVDE